MEKHFYLNDYHRQCSEASQKEIASMLEHPYTFEQAKAQAKALREAHLRKNK